MADIILDTNVLAEFLEQFFDSSSGNRGFGNFIEGRFLSSGAAREINRITRSYGRYGDLAGGVVVISSFAFVELFRKWEAITNGRLPLVKVHSILEQPPTWLSLAPLDETYTPAFLDVPSHVYLSTGFKGVEWTDAVHVATALARGDGHWIATTDEVIHHLNLPSRVRSL
jgi:predicted nucleic acid-binding protein